LTISSILAHGDENSTIGIAAGPRGHAGGSACFVVAGFAIKHAKGVTPFIFSTKVSSKHLKGHSSSSSGSDSPKMDCFLLF
jgi:hypothetical protein